MWPNNRLTELLGLTWPILQSPMGGVATPKLAAAVSNFGALGGLGMWGLSVDEVRRTILRFRQLSQGPLNVNYPIWKDPGDIDGLGIKMRERLQCLYHEKRAGLLPEPKTYSSAVSDEHLSTLEEMKPEVVSFHFGLPERRVIETLKGIGVVIICSATTVNEARILLDSGVDAIIAQGTEGGGHRGSFTGTDISVQPGLFSLLPQVVDAVDVPVIAAGGIVDGRGIAAALMLGAAGVQIGTAFLRCEEAHVSDDYRTALSMARDEDTVITDVVSGRPARFIKNRLTDFLSGETALPFPAQGTLTGPLESHGDHELMGFYAGQSVGLTRNMDAGSLVETLVQEAADCLKACSC